MANQPKTSPNHTPAATARPPAAPSHADDPPAPGAPHAAAPKHEAEIDISKLSFMVATAIGRLEAGKAEVTGWTHNLEASLQADLDNGVLTEADATAVAQKYEVKAPKPTPKPEPAEETKPAG